MSSRPPKAGKSATVDPVRRTGIYSVVVIVVVPALIVIPVMVGGIHLR